jgi:hypothetical protein
MGRDLGDDVAHLKELVKEASGACTIEYFQLIAMLCVNKKYSEQYTKSVLHDLVVFNGFSEELHSLAFRNRHVWRAWYYIRDLVVKYVDENHSVVRLDAGRADSIWFSLTTAWRMPPKAESKEGRPRKVTKLEWDKISKTSLNLLLNEACKEICGIDGRKEWRYEDLFDENPISIQALFPSNMPT